MGVGVGGWWWGWHQYQFQQESGPIERKILIDRMENVSTHQLFCAQLNRKVVSVPKYFIHIFVYAHNLFIHTLYLLFSSFFYPGVQLLTTIYSNTIRATPNFFTPFCRYLLEIYFMYRTLGCIPHHFVKILFFFLMEISRYSLFFWEKI